MEEEMSEWQPYALGIQRWYLFHRKYLDLHSHKTHVECTQSPWLSCCLCCPSFYWDPSVDDTPSAIVRADSLNQALRIEDCNGYFQLSQCFLSYKLWRLFYFVFRWSVSKRVLWALWVFRAWNLLSIALITSVFAFMDGQAKIPSLTSFLTQVLPLLHNISWSSLQFPWFCLVAKKKIWNHGQTGAIALCNFLRWTSVIAQFYLERKGKYIIEAWGQANPKDTKRSPGLNFGSSLYMFFLFPLSLPYVNWASQEGCLFYLRFSLWSSDFLLFLFFFFSLSLSFSHHHFGLLFPILTT